MEKFNILGLKHTHVMDAGLKSCMVRYGVHVKAMNYLSVGFQAELE